MRLRLASFVLFCSGTAVVWACSLNPQPFPPDTYDASADVTLSTSPDAAGGIPDGAMDDGETPKGDASADASEADASSDASDAADAFDDASDARDDVTDDGATE